MKQKFQIGEIVEAGMIVGILHPEKYTETVMRNRTLEETKQSLDRDWTEEWRLHPVYWILLKEPTRAVSYVDFLFKESNIKYYKPEYYKEIYEAMYPPQQYLGIPEHLVATQILGEGGFDLSKVEKIDE